LFENQNTNLLVALQTSPGQALQPPRQQILELTFTAVTNQTSAFVPLTFGLVSAVKSGGIAYSNMVTHPGIVTVLQDKPLLLAGFDTNHSRTLTLFGQLSQVYQLQFSTNLTGSWYPVMNYTQTDLGISISLGSSNSMIFYRIYKP
jgi:hypothetical protein